MLDFGRLRLRWARAISESSFAARCGSASGPSSSSAASESASWRPGWPMAPRRFARAREQRHAVDARARLRVGHPVPQLERPLEQRLRLAVGVDALGGRRRAHRPLERGGLLAGGAVVVGDRGGQHARRRRARSSARASARWSGGALARQQVVLDDLAQERVPEAVGPVLGHEDVAVDRLAQRVAQRALVEAAGLGQQPVVEPLADGNEPQQLLRGLGQLLDPQHQRVAQRVRRGAEPVDAGREQLLAEQRVAARALPQPLQQLVRRRLAEDVGELVGELAAGERLERDATRVRVPLRARPAAAAADGGDAARRAGRSRPRARARR